MKKFICRLLGDESGQTLTEYALILAVIAVAVIAVLTQFSGKLTTTFQDVINSF